MQTGDNTIEVSFRRRPAEGRADPPVPSFVVRLKRQADPADASTAEEVVEIRGPKRPFDERPETATLRTAFTVSP